MKAQQATLMNENENHPQIKVSTQEVQLYEQAFTGKRHCLQGDL